MTATMEPRPWMGKDWTDKTEFVGWVSSQVGRELDDESETDRYAVLNFIERIVDSIGETADNYETVKALAEWVVSDPILFRFIITAYIEGEIVHRKPIEGGVLDSKIAEASETLARIWRYVP